MAVEACGQEFEICVPDGCGGGAAIEVELPVEEAEQPHQPQQVEVLVPDGVQEGEPFTLETEWGCFEICVPEGCGPGSAVVVAVPEELLRWDDRRSSVSDCPTGDAPRRAHGRRSRDYDYIDSREHGNYDVPPTPATVCDDVGKGGYRFSTDQRVRVMRSNGSYELATIIYGYDCVFDVYYECRLDGALIKHVAEDDIEEAVDAPPDPWALFDMNDVGMGGDDNADWMACRCSNDDYE